MANINAKQDGNQTFSAYAISGTLASTYGTAETRPLTATEDGALRVFDTSGGGGGGGGTVVTVDHGTITTTNGQNASNPTYAQLIFSANNIAGKQSDTDAQSTGDWGLITIDRMYGYNGTNWDRLRSDTTNGLDVDVTRLPNLPGGTIAQITNLVGGTVTVTNPSGNQYTEGTTVGTLSSNVQFFRGTGGTLTAVGTASPLPTSAQGTYLELSGSATAGTTDLVASTDVSAYKWATVQITNTFVGTVNLQVSNDNSNFVNLPLAALTNTATTYSTSLNTTNIYAGPLVGRYARLRMNAFTSGTAQGVVEFNSFPTTSHLIGGQVAQSGVWNVSTLGTIQSGTIANITGGTITALASGTITGGTIQNLNAGTITSVANLAAGTTQVNPQPVKTMANFGTSGTAAIGTLVAAPGAGTSLYITGFSVVASSGTPEVCLSFGTVQNGAQMIARGAFSPGGGIARDFKEAVNYGTTNAPLTFLIISGAGTVNWNVTYWTGV